MEIISVKKSTMVGPARETPKGIIWLSNLDLVMTRYHIPTVYFYKPSGCSENVFDPQRLKEGLSQILVSFYPAAGRLGYDDSGRLAIVCNAYQGVLFVEAEAATVMDPCIADYTDNSLVRRLVPNVDYSGGLSSYPLLVLQVTTFKCGGVSIGVGFQHSLADGPSALHLINSWADTVRGVTPQIPPYFDRTLLRARVPPTPSFHHVEYDPSPSMSMSMTTRQQCQYPESAVAIFKLTADQLKTMKSKANIDDNSNPTKSLYTTFTTLTAHLWRCVTKARGLPDDQATKLYIPIDGRSRLRPPLPPGFFGNAIFHATSLVLAGDLQSESFVDTVRRIHEALLKHVNAEYLRSALDCIEKAAPDLSSLVREAHTFRCPNLLINRWVWLPIYDADLGSGRPVYMGPANVVQEGKMYVLPSPTDDGSLSVVTRLEKSHLKLFEKLLYEF